MHVGFGFLDVLLGSRYPVFAVVAHVVLVVGNEHAVHFKEFAEVELCGVAHLLGHVEVVVLAVAHVSAHDSSFWVGKGGVVWAGALPDGILAEHLEERRVEVGVVTLCMEVEVELEVEARLFPDVEFEPSLALCKIFEGLGGLRAAGRTDALQEDVDVGEEVVAHLGCAHDVEAGLVVVAYLVRGSPDGAAA